MRGTTINRPECEVFVLWRTAEPEKKSGRTHSSTRSSYISTNRFTSLNVFLKIHPLNIYFLWLFFIFFPFALFISFALRRGFILLYLNRHFFFPFFLSSCVIYEPLLFYDDGWWYINCRTLKTGLFHTANARKEVHVYNIKTSALKKL